MIVNSRSFKKGLEKWRRHSCDSCQSTFTSREFPDLETSLQVIKRSKRSEPFYIAKIQISLYKALDHRKNASNDAYTLMQTIYSQLLPSNSKSVTTSAISDYCIDALKHFDPLAAVKYQATKTPLMNKRDIKRAMS